MSSTYLKAAGFPLRTAVESTPATTDHAEEDLIGRPAPIPRPRWGRRLLYVSR